MFIIYVLKKGVSLAGVSDKWKKKQPENQFPRAEIRFPLKKVATPEFQNFNKALNKRILFTLDRKSVSTSWKEELVKKYVSIWLENSFHRQECLTNELFFIRQKNSFFWEQWSFFKKNWLSYCFDNGFH